MLADVTVIGTTKTAYFIDSKVSGLHYQCNNGGILKTTGVDGSFTYDNTCSEITFTLNNKVTLGKILVEDIPANDYKVYVTDLAGTSRTDTTTNYVKNVARLLQSLDSDENPKNGITIVSNNITSLITINSTTTSTTLQDILSLQYPTRTLVSELCAIVHLEEVLKDDGFYIDTMPPCKPRLALDINATSNDNSYIELIGEKNSKIYLNGVNTNLTLDSDGRYYEFELNTTIQRGTFDDFNITFVDATGKISEPLILHILNDTDQPFITNFPSDNNITVATGATAIITFTTTDDSITEGLTVSYEVLGTDKDLFNITSNGVLTLKSATNTRPLSIQIKVKDKANHYDIKSLTIN
jgi:hypothetical protein